MSNYTRPVFALITKIARKMGVQLPRYQGSDYRGFNRQMFEEVLAPAMGLPLPPMSPEADQREEQHYALLRRLASIHLPPSETENMPVVPSVTFPSGGGPELPRVSFTQLTQPSLVEGPSLPELVIALTVENAATASLTTPWSVGLAYDASGGAAYGTDYRIYQVIGGQTIEASEQVNFAPSQGSSSIILKIVNDGSSEPLETWKIQLTPTATCTIGSIPETSGVIIDDDVAPGGEGLRPQFYFQSEVFGRGPNEEAGNQANMIVDLGPGIQFFEDVNITVDAYAPDGTTEGVHYDFPDGKIITVPAGERYGKLRFRALPAGVQTTLRWVVVEMTGTNYGSIDDYDQSTRWVAVMCGAEDDERLIPPVETPDVSLDDYRVYVDRIEDRAHPIQVGEPYGTPGDPFVILLPYNRLQAGLSDRYDNALLTAAVVDGGSAWNGVAIAAHLAQSVWLDRNRPPGDRTFGTKHIFRSGTPEQEEIHWIKPHVKWLDKGVPVYISVYQQMLNGPHHLDFAGSATDPPTFGPIGSVMWGRHYSTGIPGLASPSCTRDLYITSRGHKHRFGNINFGAFGLNNNSGAPGEVWYKAAFVDNIHLIGFQINTKDITNFAPVIGVFPPRFTKLWRVAHGIVYMDQWEWINDDYETWDGGMIFQFRPEQPCSYMITNCTATRSGRQFLYIDAPGPICLIAYNKNLIGSGRSFLQVVSRPPHCTIPLNPEVSDGRNSGGPSHGLLAIVGNEIWGDRRWTDASDFDLYGHSGELYILGNKHRGDAGPTFSQGSNRRIYSLISSGDFSGIYVFDPYLANMASEFHPDYPLPATLPESGQRYFAFRYLELGKMDYQCNGSGFVGNNIIQVGGCFRFKFLPVIQAVPSPAMGGIPFISFQNPYAITPDYLGMTWPQQFPTFGGGAILSDLLIRPVLGSPYGPSDKTACRGGYNTQPGPGSIDFPIGFDESIGQACGSTAIAEHYTWVSNFASPVKFSDLTALQRESYDGRDI